MLLNLLNQQSFIWIILLVPIYFMCYLFVRFIMSVYVLSASNLFFSYICFYVLIYMFLCTLEYTLYLYVLFPNTVGLQWLEH